MGEGRARTSTKRLARIGAQGRRIAADDSIRTVARKARSLFDKLVEQPRGEHGYGPELALLEAFDWGELIEAIMINSF